LVEIVGPRLHHRSAFRQSLRAIVSSSDRIALGVPELQLNKIRVYALLVQQRARHCSKSMCRHFLA